MHKPRVSRRASVRDPDSCRLLRRVDVVAERVRELGQRDSEIDPSIDLSDARLGQCRLRIDELDGGRALGIEQLAADAIALLRRDQRGL